ncbi:MAG TPA: gliding motility-associated C-terminal domain-containing protein, partial [Bacteroidia bacterium]|nr:gliding motility-associated C-terminal domain-containing protein [Bacteroidia bacterium]
NGNDTVRNVKFVVRNNLQEGANNQKLVTITSNGCSDTATKMLTVFASPFASFAVNDSTQCLDSNFFDFTNLSVISNGTMSYMWSFDDKTFSNRDITSYSFKKWAKYPVRLVAMSDKNCPDTAEKEVFVFPNPTAAFVYLNNCLEDTMWFFDKSGTDSGIIQQWYWDFKNGKTSTMQNPFTMYYDSGQKSVTLVSTNDFGCSHDTTRFFRIETHISAPELERATVTNDNQILIEWKQPHEGIPMLYHLEKSTDTLLWNEIIQTDNKTLQYIDPLVNPSHRSYFYRVRSTDSCRYTGNYSNYGKTILLKIDTTEQFPVLFWTPYELWKNGVESYELQVKSQYYKDISDNDDYQTVVAIPTSQIPHLKSEIIQSDSSTRLNSNYYCYRVVAYRHPDRLTSVSNIVCTPTPFRLFIPNAFTPNGDEVNEVFRPFGIFIRKYNLVIFNAWGEKIFESNDPETGWDGTFKGKPCPVGNYYYQINAEGTQGQRRLVSGTVLLMR